MDEPDVSYASTVELGVVIGSAFASDVTPAKSPRATIELRSLVQTLVLLIDFLLRASRRFQTVACAA